MPVQLGQVNEPQGTIPAGHWGMHFAPAHIAPGQHFVPQPPQLFGSLSTSTHRPLQGTWLPTQGGTQVPWRQVQFLAHAVLQSPQCRGSFVAHANLQCTRNTERSLSTSGPAKQARGAGAVLGSSHIKQESRPREEPVGGKTGHLLLGPRAQYPCTS
jgi:hypothetical protein